MKVLSLFDGMSCGMIAFVNAKIPVERYVAYEIDKYAIQSSVHNFPMIEQCGDVFAGNFKQYEGFDFLVGGSPCTYWSIAQKNNRETEASGMGWELFSQYVRALKEAKPKYFIYENNKSMSKAIRQSITETFGFEPICINSALVSAQNRQRLYWIGIRQPDGTYRKADIEQPADRGILLKDILQTGCYLTCNDKSYAVAEPIRVGTYPQLNGELSESKQFRIYDINGKSTTLCGNGGGLGAKTGLYAIPVEWNGDMPTKAISQADGKTYTVYEVKDGKITIKGKTYPIKLRDGFYIICKSTVLECMRLQTVPEWYQFPVSDTQAYKQLGNGWTVDVIVHILKGLIR